MKTRKQERKANRIITLIIECENIVRRSNDNITLVSETAHKQNQTKSLRKPQTGSK